MDYEFSFKLEAAPPAGEYETINYPQKAGFSLAVAYNREYVNLGGPYEINSITIHKILPPDTKVPSAMGEREFIVSSSPRGSAFYRPISSKSLQIDYETIKMTGNCKKTRAGAGNILPKISIGETAYLTVIALVDGDSTNLTITSCKLTIEKQTYTVTPTGYSDSDNNIKKADCNIIPSGGHRRKRKATKKARRKNRRLSRRNK